MAAFPQHPDLGRSARLHFCAGKGCCGHKAPSLGSAAATTLDADAEARRPQDRHNTAPLGTKRVSIKTPEMRSSVPPRSALSSMSVWMIPSLMYCQASESSAFCGAGGAGCVYRLWDSSGVVPANVLLSRRCRPPGFASASTSAYLVRRRHGGTSAPKRTQHIQLLSRRGKPVCPAIYTSSTMRNARHMVQGRSILAHPYGGTFN
jgi:hypothetical protein